MTPLDGSITLHGSSIDELTVEATTQVALLVGARVFEFTDAEAKPFWRGIGGSTTLWEVTFHWVTA